MNSSLEDCDLGQDAGTLNRLLRRDRSKHSFNGFRPPESQVSERPRPNMLSRGTLTT
jgi:hypothetical protein